LKYLSISKVSIFPKSLNQILYRILHKRLFKFGAKLISNNLYVSDPEWFLFLYFKYWYFRSLKHFWDCNFNFVNVLELHQSMEERKMIQWKSFDLAFHFSFNQNKLWTNWRSNRALLYNKPSILYRTIGLVETNVFPDRINFYRICPLDRHVWDSLCNSQLTYNEE
jgi:hypothetical protein